MGFGDAVFRPGGLDLSKTLLRYCDFKHCDRVVDIGCGAGVTIEYMRAVLGINAIGIDQEESRVEQGNKRIPGSPLLYGNAQKLPFGDTSMEGILAECSLSVMEDAGRVLAECSRVLIPGGKLAITDLYVRSGKSANTAESGRVPATGILTYEELANLLTAFGFAILVWEDRSAALKEYVAAYIMEQGSLQQLWLCIDHRLPAAIRGQVKLGYFLLIAEKQQTAALI